jgi:hypothetical protein
LQIILRSGGAGVKIAVVLQEHLGKATKNHWFVPGGPKKSVVSSGKSRCVVGVTAPVGSHRFEGYDEIS